MRMDAFGIPSFPGHFSRLSVLSIERHSGSPPKAGSSLVTARGVLLIARSATRLLRTATLALALAASPAPLLAKDYTGTPDNYLEQIKRLKAGDRLLLESGQYRDGLGIHGLQGSADAPIAIEGPVSGVPAVFPGRGGASTVSIRDSAHVAIRHLVLDGRNLPVDAVRVESASNRAHDIVLENLLIVNHGYDQQTVGISAQSTTWNWSIRRNVILGAGTGMYLGSSDGRHPFVHGVIEHNLVLDSIGYNLQIKHQGERPSVAGLPVADGATVIHGNVFLKGHRSSRDRMARPNVLVGHSPAIGPGTEDRYLIEGNVFFGNPTEALFQGEGNVTLARNLFVNPYGDGVVLQPHHAVPRRIEVTHNFVATQGFPMRVRGIDPRFPASIRDNELVDLSDSAWHGIGEGELHSVARLARAVEHWLTTGASAQGAANSAIGAIEHALRLACGGRAGADVPAAPESARAERAMLCALSPR